MKVLLLGYGKMGKMIEGLALESGIEIAGRVDRPDGSFPTEFDVAIDFTEPAAVVLNVRRIAALRKPIVIGTTGWAAELPVVERLVDEAGIGAVYSANFSVGVNIFLKLVSEAGRLFKDLSEYEAWAYEIHHSAKKDAPSGTLHLAIENLVETGYSGHVDVASNRAGKVPGTYEVGFDSAADTVTIKHVARSREGFARGALLAARLVQGQKGLKKFQDLL